MFVGSETSFYFATIRKLTVSITALFNHIYVKRYENPAATGNILKTIRVPVSYASGEKWYVHRTQDVPAGSKVRTRMVLPRIGVKLVGIEYDAQRKLNSTNKVFAPTSSSDANKLLTSLNPVPYNFVYEVYIASKNVDDMLQILEQVLPVFTPTYNLTVKEIPELGILRDVPVELTSVNMEDNFEGAFEEPRILETTLTLTAAAYIYPAVTDTEVIKKVIASTYSAKDLEEDSKTGVITVSVDPIDAEVDDDWNIKVEIETIDDTNPTP